MMQPFFLFRIIKNKCCVIWIWNIPLSRKNPKTNNEHNNS